MSYQATDEKLTAYLLGELSAEENREIEKAIASDINVQSSLNELKATVKLASEVLCTEEGLALQLTEEQRNAVRKSAKESAQSVDGQMTNREGERKKMKITCKQCGSKYSIADDKVKGKVFKIKCKKCAEPIVVKGHVTASAAPSNIVAPPPASNAIGGAGMDDDDDAATKVFDYSTLKSTASSTPVWHIVVNEEQQGPYTASQIVEFLQQGSLDTESFVWREGFGDWKPINQVDDLMGMVSQEPPARQSTPGGGLFQDASSGMGSGESQGLFDNAPSGGLFSGASASAASPGDVFSSIGANQTQDSGGLFGSGSENVEPSGDLFANARKDDTGGIFASTEIQSPRVSEEQAHMTGRRSENSVLFSLSNLQSLASGADGKGEASGAIAPFAGGYSSDDEASGLIDIRAMASSLKTQGLQQSKSDVDDLMSFGGGGFAPALGAPVLQASANRDGMGTGTKVALGLGGVALLAVAATLVFFVVMPKEPPKNTEQEARIAALIEKLEAEKKKGASAEEIEKVKKEIEVAEQVKNNEENSPAGEEVAAKAPSESDKSRKSARKKSTATASKSNSSPKASGAKQSKSPAKSEPVAAEKPKKKANSELDDLLGSGGSKKKKSSSGGGGAVPDKLSRSQVKSGMNSVAGSVKRCAVGGEKGTVTIKMTISPSGRVSSANVTGKFAGTSAGRCAGRAARKARFPKSNNKLTVTYPFKF